ncbi:MAG: VPLPA-CTERM sorting domain-containing protein [Pseudomonadota bacterium]
MKLVRVCAAVAAIAVAGTASASSIPAVDGDYRGSYDLGNAFSTHGLWLPGFIGDDTWSIVGGSALYNNGLLDLQGSVEQTVGTTTYGLDFNISVKEIVGLSQDPYCGGGTSPGECKTATQEMKDNIVYFDMGGTGSMGMVTGTGSLAGLVMDLVMRPLPDKPGQLGFGGNWRDLEFGYSNWLRWDVIQDANSVVAGGSKFYGSGNNGDINLNFLANSTTIDPVPLPAGLPLVLTVMGAFAWMRRRQRA